MFFATEQHYKNKSNKNGTMTFNCQRTSEDGHTIENVLVQCTDIHPVLRMVVDKALLMSTGSSIKTYLNTHIATSFDSHRAFTISSLTDSRYVIGVVLSQVSPSTTVDVIFNRTEDAQMLMIACRVFFKQMERASVSFPLPEIPMWVRLHYELPDNIIFKKYRDSYGNWEVVDNFQGGKRMALWFAFHNSRSTLESLCRRYMDKDPVCRVLKLDCWSLWKKVLCQACVDGACRTCKLDRCTVVFLE